LRDGTAFPIYRGITALNERNDHGHDTHRNHQPDHPDPARSGAGRRARAGGGLVPVSDENRGKLEAKVDAFVADLVAQDAASPEFGKRVDQLTNMGRKEIAAAAGMSNRFLDRPIRAMDKDSGVGADLAQLRRTVEDLDPGRQGNLSSPRKFLGIIPFGNKLKNYFDGYTSAQGTSSRSSTGSPRARTSC
jgi:hypothetical protein